MNISTRKKNAQQRLCYNIVLGGGGFFPGGIFSRAKGDFFQASDQGIFSGGILTGRLFPVGFVPRTLSIIASRLESKSAAIGL